MRPRLLHLGYVDVRVIQELCIGGFNEAEAFTPRIFVFAVLARGGHIMASMRPRLLHLGYALDIVRVPNREDGLQ